MPSTIRPDSGQSQAPTTERVYVALGALWGISPAAAKARARKGELEYLRVIRTFARHDAVNRIERYAVRASIAARPTGAIDCSDPALHESGWDVHSADQRTDSSRYATAADGPLPIEEETELRAIYAEIGALRQRAMLIEARQEARRA